MKERKAYVDLSDKTVVHAVWLLAGGGRHVTGVLWRDEAGEWQCTTIIRSDGDGDEDPTSPLNNDKKSALRSVLKPGADLDVEMAKLRVAFEGMRDVLGLRHYHEERLALPGDEAMRVLLAKYPNWFTPYATAPRGDA